MSSPDGESASRRLSKGRETSDASAAAKEDNFKWTDLDESSRYALVTMCAGELHALYKSGRNQKWVTAYISSLIKVVGLPSEVRKSILKTCDQMNVESALYIEMINCETRYASRSTKLLHDLLLLCLQEGSYDARCRVLLGKLAETMALGADAVRSVETEALILLQSLHDGTDESSDKERQAAARKRKIKKFALIGIGAAVGATVIGLTGGLAAPLVAAGAGVLIGGGSAAILGSAVGVALITTIFTTAGAGLAGYKMNKRLGDVKEFSISTLRKEPSLRCVTVVTGWLKGDDLKKDVADFTKPWHCLDEGDEMYCVQWESKELHDLGCAVSSFVKSTAVGVAVQEVLTHTVMATLLSAIAWPATLVNVASVIDNPWQVCLNRAQDAGRLLADALLSSKEARRPMTLIGYSMGARVIFYALQELAKAKDPSGLIEDVYLLGAPVSAKPREFLSLLQNVIAGKCVIGHSKADWVLKFLHRTATASVSVVGVAPLELDHPRLVNVDLSDIVSGHLDYNRQLPLILKAVGLRIHDKSVKKDGKSDKDDMSSSSAGKAWEKVSADEPSAPSAAVDSTAAAAADCIDEEEQCKDSASSPAAISDVRQAGVEASDSTSSVPSAEVLAALVCADELSLPVVPPAPQDSAPPQGIATVGTTSPSSSTSTPAPQDSAPPPGIATAGTTSPSSSTSTPAPQDSAPPPGIATAGTTSPPSSTSAPASLDSAMSAQSHRHGNCETRVEELGHPPCPVPGVTLTSQHCIPQLGFGTYSSALSPAGVALVAWQALVRGFRHFDCTPIYDTQDALGMLFGDLPSVNPNLHRQDIFITSKLWNTLHHPSHVRTACLNCIKSLQCEYLDLFLIHSPTAMQFTGYELDEEARVPKDADGQAFLLDKATQHIDTWRAMEELVDEGLVKSIGVSNFTISHLEELLSQCRIKPAVNQIEVHPYCTQAPLVDWCQAHGVHVTAFSPLGSQTGLFDLLGDSTVCEIAQATGKSPAQVCLRWATQQGMSVIPHCGEIQFMDENLDVFSFELSDVQMQAMHSLDRGARTLNKEWLSWD